MKMLSKAILAALVAVMVGGTIALASGGSGVTPSPGPTTTSISAPRGADVKEPCDEAEHANDARCTAVQVPEDKVQEHDRQDDRNGIHDQEGPDDSGHHSTATVGSDDNSEHGTEMEARDDSPRVGEMGRADDSGDHSGNSGRGSDDHGASGRDHPEDD